MFVDIERKNEILFLKVLHPRIDGSNHMLDVLNEYLGTFAGKTTSDREGSLAGIGEIEIDFVNVTYLNSMGITELVNIYRMITDRSRGRIQFRFINVRARIHSILELVEFTKLADVRTI